MRHGPSPEQAHRSACDSFGSVLGPWSDGFHRDPVHPDAERHYDGFSRR